MTRRMDPLTAEVVDLIDTVVARFHQEYDAAAAVHRLTGVQARVLALLSGGPLPMRQIARQLRCEPSNVTGIVDRLEVQGLAERRSDPADRRVKLVAATPAGRQTATRLRESLEFARAPLAALSAQERAVLRDLLKRVLAPEAQDPPAGLTEPGPHGR